MAKAKKGSLRREFSAGGVVFRKVPDIEWLVGKHSGYHKWVLPKGVIEKGEKGLETARRETLEEMGVRAEPKAEKPIHKTSYFFWQDGRRVFKQVTFYLMKQVGGDVGDHGWEMSEVLWMPYKEAKKLLAFEGEREALGIAHEMVE